MDGFLPVVPPSAITMIFSARVSLHVLHLGVEVRWLRIAQPYNYRKQYLEGK